MKRVGDYNTGAEHGHKHCSRTYKRACSHARASWLVFAGQPSDPLLYEIALDKPYFREIGLAPLPKGNLENCGR